MGIREADIDGIEHYYDPNEGKSGRRGTEIFVVPCSFCGAKILRKTYGRNAKYICDACRIGQKEDKKVEQKKRDAFVNQLYETITTKEEQRFNKAVDAIAKQVRNFDSYEKDIEIARRGQFKYGSVPEAMTAIYLPKNKMVIEVDGSLYHQDMFKGDREATIQFSLGLDVKIIHVPAEAVSKNIHIINRILRKLP